MVRTKDQFHQNVIAIALGAAALLLATSIVPAQEAAPQEPLDLFALDVLSDGQAEPLDDAEIADVRGESGRGEASDLGLTIFEDPNRRIGATSGIDPTGLPKQPPGNVPWFAKLP